MTWATAPAATRMRSCKIAVPLICWTVATLLHPHPVLACPAMGSMRTVFFQDVPPGIDAPVIVRIAVTRLLESNWGNKQGSWFNKPRTFAALARVDHVVSGAIGSKMIKIIAPESSCDHPLAVGESGVVAGKLAIGDSGMPVLRLISESHDQRLARDKKR
jgi:hypothetical protein